MLGTSVSCGPFAKTRCCAAGGCAHELQEKFEEQKAVEMQAIEVQRAEEQAKLAKAKRQLHKQLTDSSSREQLRCCVPCVRVGG